MTALPTQADLNTFNSLYSSGDYAGAGSLAAQFGFSGEQVANYLNSNYGTSFTQNDVNPYLNGVSTSQGVTNGSADYYNPSLPTGPDPTYQSGYGGYQPAGSKYAGDNPMPVSYQQQVPQIQNDTQSLINAAMNIALQHPEWSDYRMNQLRGGGSVAMGTAQQILEENGYNTYTTHDYGLAALKPATGTSLSGMTGLNFNAPSFDKPYDPDWNRPTLYDMVNGTYGWSNQSINLADPSVRAKYPQWNQKLTDSQITQFQNGSVPANIQSMASQFGAAVPQANLLGNQTGGAYGGSSNGMMIGNPNSYNPQEQSYFDSRKAFLTPAMGQQANYGMYSYMGNPYGITGLLGNQTGGSFGNLFGNPYGSIMNMGYPQTTQTGDQMWNPSSNFQWSQPTQTQNYTGGYQSQPQTGRNYMQGQVQNPYGRVRAGLLA